MMYLKTKFARPFRPGAPDDSPPTYPGFANNESDEGHGEPAHQTTTKKSIARLHSEILSEQEAYEHDPSLNPRLWTIQKKMSIAFFVLLSAFTATLGTPIYVAAIPNVQHTFKLTTTMAILPSSLYALALGLGVLFASGVSELYGRRIIYRVTLPGALLLTVLASVSTQFHYMTLCKAFAGLFSAPNLTLGVGVLNDMWDPTLDPVGTLVAVLFVLSVIWATQVGPMASASIMENWGRWQWTFHVSSLLLILCIAGAFAIPETFAPELRRRRAKRRGLPAGFHSSTWTSVLSAIGRPLHMLIVEPVIFPTGLVLSITQSVVFSYYVAYAYLFESVYGFTQWQVGMSFAPLVVGSLCSIPVVALCDKLIYQKARQEALEKGTMIQPEKRLYPAMISSITMPISLFWQVHESSPHDKRELQADVNPHRLAWTGKKGIPWIVPVLSGVLFGFSYVLNMLCLPVYNNDIYTTQYSASVIAATTFMRFIISPCFLIIMPKMLGRLGLEWSVSLLGFATVALMPVPWVFFKYGPSLRARSKYLKML